MTIRFYICTAPRNHVNKQMTGLFEAEGTLREETSWLNPEITVEVASKDLGGANMCQIVELGRYYFINDVVILRNHLFKLICHEDVLTTFYTPKAEGIVKRNSTFYNLYYDDGSFKKDSRSHVLYYKFPQSLNDMRYVLAVAGWGNHPAE